jgi:hypothetical protein
VCVCVCKMSTYVNECVHHLPPLFIISTFLLGAKTSSSLSRGGYEVEKMPDVTYRRH